MLLPEVAEGIFALVVCAVHEKVVPLTLLGLLRVMVALLPEQTVGLAVAAASGILLKVTVISETEVHDP